MSFRNPLLGTASHVGEHVVAIVCVSTVEPFCRPLVENFGQAAHTWPGVAYVVVAAVLYAAGFFTARIARRWLKAPKPEPPPDRIYDGEILSPPPPSRNEPLVTVIIVAPASTIVQVTEAAAAAASAANGLLPPP